MAGVHHAVHLGVRGWFVGLVLSFCHMGPGVPIQVVKFGNKQLYLPNHFVNLRTFFLNVCCVCMHTCMLP